MSEALIIAIIGQVATLFVVIFQQIFYYKNNKSQRKLEFQKLFYDEKKKAYKKLIRKLSDVRQFDINDTDPFFDIFYQEVYIYASDELISAFRKFHSLYCKIVDYRKKKNSNQKTMAMFANLGSLASDICKIAREELQNYSK